MPNEFNRPKPGGSDEPLQPKTEWQSIDDIANNEDFEAFLSQKFPREFALLQQSKMNRRGFLKLMGASLALAGFGLSGCTNAEPPGEDIIPYVRRPEVVIPGKPIFFASTMTLGGYAQGVLIETHEGRPTRLEGNPNHPASLGASDVFTQASILDLYDPERAVLVSQDGEPRTWSDFQQATQDYLAANTNGSGLRILTETVTSPTLHNQLTQLLEKFPEAKWYQYEPIAQDNVIAGARIAFDDVVNTVYHFENANVILSIDSDFLTTLPGSVAYARNFMQRRTVNAETGDMPDMNRLYAIQSSPTSTGVIADHELALSPSQIENFARALAAAFDIDVETNTAANWPAEWFNVLVEDLRQNEGSSLVVAGFEQPPIVHALVHAINEALGNIGNTVVYTEPVIANPVIQTEELAELTQEMQDGAVSALFIIGGNPVFTAPADINFNAGLDNVPFVTHLSFYNNETTLRANWHIPQAHFIEEWSDARAFDGTASIVQPPIGPLLDTVRSAHELLALLLEDERSAYQIVRSYWQNNISGDNFEAIWRRALHNGIIENTAAASVSPTLRSDLSQQLAEIALPTSNGIEVVFRPDTSVWDGRFINNSYLREIPKPVTKVTWDPAAIISPATANSLGVERGDIISLQVGGNAMQAPVFILPGQADNTIAMQLGYGQPLMSETTPEAFNAYAMRTTTALWYSTGVQVANTGENYVLAAVQSYYDPRGTQPVRNGTLEQYRDNPAMFEELDEYGDDPKSLIPEFAYEGYAWGMTIDLTACIGCNACIMACQMENNIPVVGKEGVRQAREMHWIRVDTYRHEVNGEYHNEFQPVPCMHCENAPCELVCPVQATVHDHEGLNTMVYNRCVGTRYCSANCPYGVRRFNFFDNVDDAPIMQEFRNPDVSVRPRGVMEKCTYCVQRINQAHIAAGTENRPIRDGEIVPACASTCPTQAIVFGDVSDADTKVAKLKATRLNYGLLAELNTQPRTTYLARLSNPNAALNGSPSVGAED